LACFKLAPTYENTNKKLTSSIAAPVSSTGSAFRALRRSPKSPIVEPRSKRPSRGSAPLTAVAADSALVLAYFNLILIVRGIGREAYFGFNGPDFFHGKCIPGRDRSLRGRAGLLWAMMSMKAMQKPVRETKTTGRERSSDCVLSLLQISHQGSMNTNRKLTSAVIAPVSSTGCGAVKARGIIARAIVRVLMICMIV
jgi:hypothetical protein